MEASTGTRICPKCKLPGEFWKNRKECKTCGRAYLKLWHAKNPQKSTQYNKYDSNKAAITSLRRAARRRADPEFREKEIRNNWNQKLKKYGITADDYDRMFEAQGRACAICREFKTRTRLGRQSTRLHVDHDHQTGKVRGLLCTMCNSGLGYFKDSVPRLEAAIEYLRL